MHVEVTTPEQNVGDVVGDINGRRGRIESMDLEERRDPQRIFTSDVSAVAAPISNRGVIYVGSQQEYQLSDQELQYLDSLARHSWLALQAAQSQEEQQVAYQGELLARQVSEKLLNRLADLVAGMNQLLPLSEPDQLVTAGAELMQRLLRSQDTWTHFKGNEKNFLQGPLDGIRELAQSSLKARRPILHNEVQTSPFFRPGSPYKSVLVVPLTVHQEESGFLLAAREEAYEREDQDILTLMALQFGPILETVRLYFDLQVAHERLAESQAQLVQSSKMAAIGQLAGGVAHELNTPLGAVTVSLDAIALSIDSRPEKAKERLEKTRKACAKMKSIIAFYSTRVTQLTGASNRMSIALCGIRWTLSAARFGSRMWRLIRRARRFRPFSSIRMRFSRFWSICLITPKTRFCLSLPLRSASRFVPFKRGLTAAFRCAILDRGSRRTRGNASSTRFSPPSRWGRERVSGCRFPCNLPNKTEEVWRF